MSRTGPALTDRLPGGVEELRTRVERHLGGPPPKTIRVIRDTSNFLTVSRGDVLLLGGRHYLVRGNEREGRFGLDEEPKLWVKRAIDLATSEVKIITNDAYRTPRVIMLIILSST